MEKLVDKSMRQNAIFKINNQNLYEDLILIDDIYPVLFTCVDDFENTYLSICYFADPSKILWLVTKTAPERVIDLLNNKVTIRELFESDELWAICKSKNEEIQVKRIEVIIPGLFEPPVRTLRATIPENESHIFR